MRRLLLPCILLAAATCAYAGSVNPKRLQQVEGGTTYRLQEAWSYQEKAATFTLQPGD